MGCIMGTKRNITQENIDFGLTTNAEENLLILNGYKCISLTKVHSGLEALRQKWLDTVQRRAINILLSNSG